MKISLVRTAAACAAALAVAATVATPAYAIERVYAYCDQRNSAGYLYIKSQGNDVCFAKAGGIPVELYGVTQIQAAGNRVVMSVIPRQGDGAYTLEIRGTYDGPPLHMIKYILMA